MIRIARRLLDGVRFAEWKALRMRAGRCPYCGPTVLVRLRRDEIGVRCLRCGASAVHLAIGHVLHAEVGDPGCLDACELSARGALADWLRGHARTLALSEFVPGAPAGSLRAGVRCEDVQALSYADASFDLVTHTEVFEHVPDDVAAFAELHRILRPGGRLVFSVPLLATGRTLERARLRGGTIEYLQEPSHHSDPLRDGARILVFRDYGTDIVERVAAAGFVDVRLRVPPVTIPWVQARAIICAHKPSEDPHRCQPIPC